MENYNNFIYQARFLVKSNWLQAVQILEEAIQNHPDAKALYFELADIYKQKKSLKKVIDNYQKILNLDDKDTLARFKLANTYLEMDEAKIALYHYNKIEEEFPELLYNKALANYYMLKYNDAIKALSKLIEISPKANTAYTFLIELLINNNKLNKAFNYLNLYESRFGTTPNINYLRGFAYLQKNNWLAAYNEYLLALPGFQDNYRLHHFLALSAEKIGQIDKALQHYKNAIDLKKEDKTVILDFIKFITNNNLWDKLLPNTKPSANKKKELKKILNGVDEATINMALKFFSKRNTYKQDD